MVEANETSMNLKGNVILGYFSEAVNTCSNKFGLKGICCEDIDGIHLGQERDQWGLLKHRNGSSGSKESTEFLYLPSTY